MDGWGARPLLSLSVRKMPAAPTCCTAALWTNRVNSQKFALLFKLRFYPCCETSTLSCQWVILICCPAATFRSDLFWIVHFIARKWYCATSNCSKLLLASHHSFRVISDVWSDDKKDAPWMNDYRGIKYVAKNFVQQKRTMWTCPAEFQALRSKGKMKWWTRTVVKM